MRFSFRLVGLLLLPWVVSCDCGGTKEGVAHGSVWGDEMDAVMKTYAKDGKLSHLGCWNLCLGALELDDDTKVTTCANINLVGYLAPDGTIVPEWSGGMGGAMDDEGRALIPTGMPKYEFDCFLEYYTPRSIVAQLYPKPIP